MIFFSGTWQLTQLNKMFYHHFAVIDYLPAAPVPVHNQKADRTAIDF